MQGQALLPSSFESGQQRPSAVPSCTLAPDATIQVTSYPRTEAVPIDEENELQMLILPHLCHS